MQTVQAAFKNADKEALIKKYLHEYPATIDDFDDGLTVGEAKDLIQKQLSEYIDRLRSIDIKQPKDGCQDWIFYVYHCLDDEVPTARVALSRLSDLREKGVAAEEYGYEFTEQAKLMGYYVADNKLTQHYLDELLVEIMYEASFFGFEQEDLQDELDELARRKKEISQGKAILFDEFAKKVGFTELDEFSPLEEKYLEKVIAYQIKISQNSKLTEIKQILAA